MTKEEVKAGLQACAQKLGRTPKYAEVHKMTRITRFWIQKYFSSMGHALREAGVEPKGSGHRVETAAMMEDWAGCARKLGKAPSLAEYRKLGRFSVRPFFDRWGSWAGVPGAFRCFVRECEREQEWADVLVMIAKREQQEADTAFRMPQMDSTGTPALMSAPQPRRKMKLDRPIYGAPSPVAGLRYEPVNEQGVIYAFGMVAAERLGIQVERMQAEFPDCEAMREVEAGKWQRVKIEIEFASRNYLAHKHPLDGCDVIVCWIHNWPECPEHIEVIELRRVV